MRKIIFCAFILGAAFASPAAAQIANPVFSAQIQENGRRMEVFASSKYDHTFRCDLNVRFETADNIPGNFLCKAQVSGKTKKTLVCSSKSKGERYISVGRIKKFCIMH